MAVLIRSTRGGGGRGEGGGAEHVLAYSNGNRYPKPYVYERVTGRTEVLWPQGPLRDTSYELGTAAAISADGRHVAYTLGNRHGDDYARVLHVRDLDTGADREISPLPSEGMILDAWLSADGRTVAYSVAARTDHGTEGRIHVVRDGHESAVGSGFPATLVRLSDDGRSALFNATAADRPTTAYVQDLRTGRVRQVAGTEAVAADGSLRHVLLSGDGGLDLLTLPSGRRGTRWPRRAPPPFPRGGPPGPRRRLLLPGRRPGAARHQRRPGRLRTTPGLTYTTYLTKCRRPGRCPGRRPHPETRVHE
ncbi:MULTISPECIES: hypothetical protein [unclassified Streptomyces]|uniref:hypothetical protein n=1 Tax=unclassified Streptomyces TaxID=2593676 RepID=UPI0033DBE76D